MYIICLQCIRSTTAAVSVQHGVADYFGFSAISVNEVDMGRSSQHLHISTSWIRYIPRHKVDRSPVPCSMSERGELASSRQAAGKQPALSQRPARKQTKAKQTKSYRSPRSTVIADNRGRLIYVDNPIYYSIFLEFIFFSDRVSLYRAQDATYSYGEVIIIGLRSFSCEIFGTHSIIDTLDALLPTWHNP